MQVPYLDRPLCEPVQLRPGAKLRIRRVSEASDAAANVPFPHYHDVCELVLFGRVRGSFVVPARLAEGFSAVLRKPVRVGALTRACQAAAGGRPHPAASTAPSDAMRRSSRLLAAPTLPVSLAVSTLLI